MSPTQRLAEVARRQHGTFSRAQALSSGFTRRQIERRSSNGTWTSLHAGVYAWTGAPVTFETRASAAVLAAGPDAYASHRTAARLLAFERFADAPGLEVVVVGRSGRNIPGIFVHRPRFVLADDMTVVDGIPVTGPLRTFFDLAAVLPKRAFEPAFDEALRRRLFTLGQVRERWTLAVTRGVPGTATIRALLEERSSDPLTESVLETMFYRLVVQAGLPEPIAQYEVRDVHGVFIARVDFAYPHARLAIELDGFAFHSDKASFQRDRARQNDLVALGWTLLRFTKTDLISRSRSTVGLVEGALRPVVVGPTLTP